MRKTKLDESVKAVGRGIFRLLKTESVVEKTIHEQSVRDHTTERFKQILERRRSSKKEHKANAWAIGAEEGRGKLRKAAVRCKRPNDPRMSEWGNLPGVMLGRPYEVGDPVK